MAEELFDFRIDVQVLAKNRDEARKFLEEETKDWQASAFGYPSIPLDQSPPFVNDFEIHTDRSKTTWGDCGNPDCREYGRMLYNIRPGTECERCGRFLRAWNKEADRGYTQDELERLAP